MKFIIILSTLWTICFQTVYATLPPPHDGRFARAEFVSSLIKPGDVGAEIGVFAGVFAYHVLLPSQPSKLYLIDPWQYGLQADMELAHQHLKTTKQRSILRICLRCFLTL